MRKVISLWVGLALLLSACALLQPKGQRIVWPEQIRYMEAMCELDMSWQGMNYDGSMSLIMDYPSQLRMELYGPFGNTLMLLKKDNENFLLVTKDEKITDPTLFEDRFGFKIREFMDDIAMIPQKSLAGNGQLTVQKAAYRVLYRSNNKESTMCLENREGSICIKFLEVKFG